MPEETAQPPARKSLPELAGDALQLQTSEGLAVGSDEGREGLIHELTRVRKGAVANNTGTTSFLERSGGPPVEREMRFVPSEEAVPQLELLLKQTLPRMQAKQPLMRDDENVVAAALPPKDLKPADTSFLAQLAQMLREEADDERAQSPRTLGAISTALTDRPADPDADAQAMEVSAQAYEHNANLLASLQERVQACAQLMPTGRRH